jgi:hypothetical protein
MAGEQKAPGTQSYIVQCSPDKFEHASWLSAVFSEVLSVNEDSCRLHIAPLSDLLRGQLDKLGARITARVTGYVTHPA